MVGFDVGAYCYDGSGLVTVYERGHLAAAAVNGELGGARWRYVADASGHGYADFAVLDLCLVAAACTFADPTALFAEGCTALVAGMRAARRAGMCAMPVRASASVTNSGSTHG